MDRQAQQRPAHDTRSSLQTGQPHQDKQGSLKCYTRSVSLTSCTYAQPLSFCWLWVTMVPALCVDTL
jgi:hypothetical protein